MNHRTGLSATITLSLFLATAARAGVPPLGSKSSAVPSVTFDASSGVCDFLAGDPQEPVLYRVVTTRPDVAAGALHIEATAGRRAPVVIVDGAGTRYRDAAGNILEPPALAALGTTSLVDARLDNGALLLTYQEKPGGHLMGKTFRLSLHGRSLTVEVSSTDTSGQDGYAGVSLGGLMGVLGARAISLPYLVQPIAVLPDGTYFTAYLDPTLSGGTEVVSLLGPDDSAGAFYVHGRSLNQPDITGNVAPLSEVGYLTVSSLLTDVFPGNDRPPSSYRAELSGRLVLDVWGLHQLFPDSGGPAPGLYRRARTMVRRYAEYGMRQLAILFHDWQRHGYDAGLPEHYPANPVFGTGAEMATFVGEAKAAGMLVALHENYTDMYPDHPPDYPSPMYDDTAIAHQPDGQAKLGWFNPGTLQQAVRIAADRMLSFASRQSPLIAADYAPNAAYLDVSTGWTPGMAIDFAPASLPASPPTLAAATQRLTGLFDAMRGFYHGPLFGEGGEGPGRWDSMFAGAVDGVERQTEGRRYALAAPDFELLVVKPRMLNHGLGYYVRYFVDGGQATPPADAIDLDQYRAGEILFGHAGFLDQLAGNDLPSMLRAHAAEYWLLQALQSRYADAVPVQVLYHLGDLALDLGQALRAGMDLSAARVSITYDNGLELYVNRDQSQKRANSTSGFSAEQGGNGWTYDEVDEGVAPPGGRTPMHWNPVGPYWQGSAFYLRLWDSGGHPFGKAASRVWTSPVAANIHINGAASDLDPNCGDGVEVSIRQNDQILWDQLIANGEPNPRTFDLTVQVAAGDRIDFRISQRADPNCDSTAFSASIAYQDGSDHTWTVSTPHGDFQLPPSGFVALAPDGLRAYTALQGGQVVDYLSAPSVRFVRSRTGQAASIEEFTTDGALAVVPDGGGFDLHGLGLSHARWEGSEITLSARADLNLLQRDERSAVLAVRNLEQGTTVDFTWSALPPSWDAILTAHPAEVELHRLDDSDQPVGAALSLSTLSHALVFPGLEAEQRYLVGLTSPCITDADCPPGLACDTGRCVVAPDGGEPDGSPDGDGMVADSGTDGGTGADPDAGADADAGHLPDSALDGSDPGPSNLNGSGCGCGSAGAGLAWPVDSIWLLGMLALALARRISRKA